MTLILGNSWTLTFSSVWVESSPALPCWWCFPVVSQHKLCFYVRTHACALLTLLNWALLLLLRVHLYPGGRPVMRK